MNEICSIIITFNRKELLLRNIQSLLTQSIQTDIMIIDNFSTDGTKDLLTKEGIIDRSNVRYLNTFKNLGGAGGFNFGLQKAFELGYKWFFLMDDDGYCYYENTLESVYRNACNFGATAVFNACVVRNDKKMLTFKLDDLSDYEVLYDQSHDGLYYGDINPFNGTLIPREVVVKIGFPRKEFFIYGDELEYLMRIRKNGFKVVTDLNAFYYHPVNAAPRESTFLKKKLLVYDIPIWKNYCSVRNTVYTLRLYGLKNKDAIYWSYLQILSAWCCKGKKLRRLYYVVLAINDGMHGNFNREIKFNL